MEAKLTNEEKLFCELYANGDAPFAGNATRCYEEAFADTGGNVHSKAIHFLAREDVQCYLRDLEKLSFDEARYMKKFLTQNLTKIVEECATKQYLNKKGQPMSPAPLRSVAVSASKALMDMYPVKEANKISVESNDGNGITFNVIMPEKPVEKEQVK
jgi:hypothetical protein